MSAVRPSIRLSSSAIANDDAVGRSRIGGLPDLPADSAWPHNDGDPLSFIAQINLADARRFDSERALPASGLLSFFYDAVSQDAWGFDPADSGASAVVYSPSSELLVRHDVPSTLDPAGVFEPAHLTLTAEPTFLGWESFAIAGLGLNRKEQHEYGEIFDDERYEPDGLHRLLGHPDPIQGDMQVECQFASNGLYCGHASAYLDPRAAELRTGAGDWRLLLQIDSDENVGMMWGDVGRIYYWIRDEDLAACNWELSWLILQCS